VLLKQKTFFFQFLTIYLLSWTRLGDQKKESDAAWLIRARFLFFSNSIILLGGSVNKTGIHFWGWDFAGPYTLCLLKRLLLGLLPEKKMSGLESPCFDSM